MTNGTVIILGKVEQNVGSGMTGGKIYLWGKQEDKINQDYIISAPFIDNEYSELKLILDYYYSETSSNTATFGSLLTKRFLKNSEKPFSTISPSKPLRLISSNNKIASPAF